MAVPKAGNLHSENTCSVCLELVNDTHERSIAKLICGHQFHLDCIGSAFNAKGSMQCPNCRQIENGDWLYGNGRPHLENSMLEDMMFEEEYEVEYEMFARVSELFFPEQLMIWQSHWCPYQGSYTDLSLSLGNGDHLPTPYAEVVLDVLVGENLESAQSVHPSPFVHAQAPVLDRRTPGVEENVGVPASSARLRHGAAYQQHFSPSIEQWGRQSPAVVESNGVAGGISLEEGSAGHSWPSQSRHDGRRRRSSASAGANIPSNQFLPRPASWRYAGTSAVQDAVREAQPWSNTNFRQRRRDGSSRFGQYPSEPEGQRWAPPPLLGLPGARGILATQVASSDHHVQATSQAHHLYRSAEDMDVQPSRSFYQLL